jgi:multicomponent K+:H+ antiporter subunit A
MSLALIVLLPLLGALLPPLIIRSGRSACATTAFFISLLSFLLLMTHAPAIWDGQSVQAAWAWMPQTGLHLAFFLDALGFFFAGLILLMGLLVIVYARFYLSRKDPMGSFYAYLLLFQAAMLGIVLSDNVLMLVVFWELTSLSSFLLIGFWKHLPDGRRGARMALAVTGAGGLCLLAGLWMLGHVAGSWNLSVILTQGELIRASPLYLPALLLILLGCFTKSAQFPFHFWLPHAMAAPTPVSAYLHSATMVKAGLFMLARLWPVLSGTPEWFYLVTTTGAVTLLVGAWIACFKDDLKGLLAFSTVSHLGLITLLFGLGTSAAAFAAVFHILNHATFKAALFMNAGIIDHETGTRHIPSLSGLAFVMPLTATLGMIAAASMAGFPPFNGFLSKELMLEQVAQTPFAGFPGLLGMTATLAALLSVTYALRYILHVFWGPLPLHLPKKPHDPPIGLWLPPALLIVPVILIGLFPQAIAGPLVARITQAVTAAPLPPMAPLSLWHGLTPALGMSLFALFGGLILIRYYRYLRAFSLRLPRIEARALFEAGMACAVEKADRFTFGVHIGSLQRYLAILLGTALLAGLVGFFHGGHTPGTRSLLPLHPLALVIFGLLCAACTLLLFQHHARFLALITVGVIGLIVCVAFIHFSAPDLALTQISVEVVTVILMLLALNFLPKETPNESPPHRRLWHGLLAGLAGVGMTALSLAMMSREFSSLSDYYLQQALPGGGGTNVVNVILVDFRGFDTFGEIIVLGIAALAIFALLDGALRGRVGGRVASWVPDQRRSSDRHPMMLVVGARVMLPLALLVAAYIFLRGHNLPGGGFIAALVVAIALIMQYMASGFGWAAQRMHFDYHAIIGMGIVIAAATGMGSWLMDYPFLTSSFTYLDWPLVGKFELATAMAFDAGVLLTVVGAVMLALANLSRIGRRAENLSVNPEPMDNDPSAVTALPKGRP